MKRILSGRFQLIGHREWFFVSTVYGPHIPVETGSFLLQLQQLGNLHTEKLWLIADNFNMTTSKEEKKGGLQREEPEMERFRDIQLELKMIDIHTINGKFTWNNCRGGSKQITCRLDRFLAIEHFIGKDIFYEATILPCQWSDHWSIKLEIAMNHKNQNKPFRFEAFLLQDATFIENMEQWWKENETGIKARNKMHTLQLRLKDLKGKIKKWNREEFGHIQKDQEKL